ncbi:HEPN domain-containing protein [Acinetobacter baumannii]
MISETENESVHFVMDVSLDCTKCGADISQKIRLPQPDFNSDGDFWESQEDYDHIYCDKCGKEYLIDITCNYEQHHFSCVLRETQNEISDGVPYYDDPERDELNWIIKTTQHYEILREQLNKAEELNRAIDANSDLKSSQNIMLYGHVVAAIEGFLGSTFIHYVLTFDSLFNKFINSNRDFEKVSFKIQDFTGDKDPIRDYVKNYLDNFIFHRIDKIKPLFKEVLGFDFGDISWLMKAVHKRHDCVHRAGFTKQSVPVDITEDEIYKLIDNAQNLGTKLNIYLDNKINL